MNQFVYRLYQRPPTPRIRNLTLSFNNVVMIRDFLVDGLTPDATRELPPLCFYHRANYLTVNCIRDNPAIRTLTSAKFSESANTTVMRCVNFCIIHGNHTFAGLENGTDCCEYTSLRCLQVVLQFRDFIVLITRFKCQIVEIP